VLRRQPIPFPCELTQAFRMHALGQRSMQADGGQTRPLFNQASESAMAHDPGRLANPREPADCRGRVWLQQLVQSIALYRRQIDRELMGDVTFRL
jgi:hypothetical protein